jgi:dihydrolipoamide dehydrogenase
MYDLAIIGGGPGGYVAAVKGAQHGLKVLLVEKDALGGTCLNRGCIPTKCFVYDSKLFEAAKKSSILTGTDSLAIDPHKMLNRKRTVVNTMVNGLGSLLKSNGIDIVNGTARLLGTGKLQVKTSEGPGMNYSARNIILATGSKPAVPPFVEVDGRCVQTTDEALETEELPKKVIIIGGGVIGIEMATIFLNIGAKITIIEMLTDILTTEDQDVRREMKRQFENRGAQVLLNTSVQAVVTEGARVKVSFQRQGQSASETLTVDKVLVATGRLPVLDGIDTTKLGLETEGPFIRVNSKMETNLPGVYAIGDLVGGMMLAHKASAEAEAVVENILGASHSVDPHLIPRCIWGLLEIGAVGMGEEDAIRAGRKIKIGRFPFAASGAAQAMRHPDGFAKIIGDAETGEIIGVHIIGEHATEMIAEATTVMKMEGAVEDLYEAVKPHPTVSEVVLEAALDWNSLAIHVMRQKLNL